MRISVVARVIFSDRLCINDTIGSLLLWSQSIPPASAIWNFTFPFTSKPHQSLFHLLYKDQYTSLYPTSSLMENLCFLKMSVVDISYIASSSQTTFEWCNFVNRLCTAALASSPKFRLMMTWVPELSFSTNTRDLCLSKLQSYVPVNWALNCFLVESQQHSDHIEAIIFLMTVVNFDVYYD